MNHLPLELVERISYFLPIPEFAEFRKSCKFLSMAKLQQTPLESLIADGEFLKNRVLLGLILNNIGFEEDLIQFYMSTSVASRTSFRNRFPKAISKIKILINKKFNL